MIRADSLLHSGSEILRPKDTQRRIAGESSKTAILINGSANSIATHLSFSVVSANSAKTSAMIQKRAMTLDSDQPASSK